LCAPEESIANTVSVVDFPGFAQQTSTSSALDQLLNNAATEAVYNMTLQNFFDRKADMLESEEVSVAATSYFDNSDAVRGILKPGNGLLSILDDQTRRNRSDIQLLQSLRKRFEGKNPAIEVGSATAKLPGINFMTENTATSFVIKYFAGEVEYPVKGLVKENAEIISSDLLNMINSTKSEFIARLFSQEALQTVTHPHKRTTVMQATQQDAIEELEQTSQVGDSRKNTKVGIKQGASGQFLSSLKNIQKAVTDPSINAYFVFCLKPNDRLITNQFDNFSLFLPFSEFLSMTDAETILISSERERVKMVIEEKRWPNNEVRYPIDPAYASDAGDERLISGGNTPLMYSEKGKAGYFNDARSEAGVSAFGGGDIFKNLDTREQRAERGNEKKLEEVEEYKDKPS
ncbi:myosin head-domain-containing protein, partial [Dactylonectria macrodidyma]